MIARQKTIKPCRKSAQKKRRVRPKRKATAAKVPDKWRRILQRLPGYDSIGTAGDCRFDHKAAQRALDFFPECLRHVKGPKAGEPFVLEPWQQSVVANLFGWKRKDGTRRYRTLWLYVAKKNGKTAFGAGLIIYMLVSDGESGAELYSAACSREQASLVFDHAAGMVKSEPELARRLEIFGDSGGGQNKSIVFTPSRSFYRPLAADAHTADGTNPHLAFVDEVHRHKKRELADVLKKSMAARSQPLIIYATTADYDRESLCNELLEYARRIRDGVIADAEFLPVIFEPSEKDLENEDAWKDPKVWKKANPNMGVTVSVEFLRHECEEAQRRPVLENSFKRLHLNIVTEQIERWIVMTDWIACTGAMGMDPILWREYMLEELRGQQCYGGLDLGSTSDLSSLVLLFEDPENHENLILMPWFWMPKEGIRRKNPQYAELYLTWIRQGFVTETEGNVIDYDAIRQDIAGVRGDPARPDKMGLADQFGIRELAVDRLFQGVQLCTQLMEDGLEVISFGQGFISMAAPAKEFYDRVVGGRFLHGDNPVLSWMASNVAVRTDDAGNMKPIKPEKNSPNKIDGIVSAIMALGRAVCQGEEQGDSVYDGGESLFL